MAVTIPLDTRSTRTKVEEAFNRRKSGEKPKPDTPEDDSVLRRKGQEDAKRRQKLKEERDNANTSLARQQEINEELKAMNDTTSAERDQLRKELEEARAKIEKYEPVIKKTEADEHRRRSLLLTKIHKEKIKPWMKDASVEVLEDFVANSEAAPASTIKGTDWASLTQSALSSDEGAKALDAAVEKDAKGFNEFMDKQGK